MNLNELKTKTQQTKETNTRREMEGNEDRMGKKRRIHRGDGSGRRMKEEERTDMGVSVRKERKERCMKNGEDMRQCSILSSDFTNAPLKRNTYTCMLLGCFNNNETSKASYASNENRWLKQEEEKTEIRRDNAPVEQSRYEYESK